MSTTDRFHSLVRAINPDYEVVGSRRLTGGVAATITSLDILHGDRSFRLVVREYGERQLSFTPDAAQHESDLLNALGAHDVPTPVPVFRDLDGAHTGSPCVVLEFIEGHAGFGDMDSDEAIQLFAEALARTHRINPNDVDVDHLPDQMALLNDKISQRPDELDDSLREGEIRAALEASRPDLTTNPTTFLHGDYWPNNTMWLDSELSAIIDWEDALIGDALQDVANARMELMMEIGPRAMEMFTEAYVRLAPDLDYGKLAFWDLYVALKPMGRIAVWAEHDDVREEMLRAGHWAFVQQALYCIDKDENIEYK